MEIYPPTRDCLMLVNYTFQNVESFEKQTKEANIDFNNYFRKHYSSFLVYRSVPHKNIISIKF